MPIPAQRFLFQLPRTLTTQSRPFSSKSYRLVDTTCPYIRPLTLTSSPRQSISGPDLEHDDFVLYPNFLSDEEQKILLRLALWKLDRVDGKLKRRRRRVGGAQSIKEERIGGGKSQEGLEALFKGQEEYGFEEGHFDSVISSYRESLLTAFPNPSTLSSSAQSNASGGFSDVLHYPSILKRLYALLPHSPTSDLARAMHESLVLPDQSARRADHPDEPFVAPLKTTTHALHLSPIGRIDKHVDNVEASGSTIIGLSLGSERILRLERDDVSGEENGAGTGWDVLLKSGSVYVQKDTIRYSYAHSILPYGPDVTWEGSRLVPGHRVSLMIRDAKSVG